MKATVMAAGVAGMVAGCGAVAQSTLKQSGGCTRVEFEGDVKAGQGFQKVFAQGLKFYLEPLASGWIVRVLPTNGPREAHDYAELATPPYRSVSPLLLSTDWSFRAQDAVGWNPRRFQYARSRAVFERLAALYPAVMAGDGAKAAEAAILSAEQPEGEMDILEAHLVPGLADQARMAATVASHFAQTPHFVDQAANASPLGKLEEVRFRVKLEIPEGVTKAGDLKAEKIPCTAPTVEATMASQKKSR